MVKINSINITLDNNKNVFQPGEIVSGNVFIDVKNAVNVKVVRIELRGWCKVKWKVSKGGSNGSDDKVYKEKENYVALNRNLWGGVENQESPISVGIQQQAFVFQLPNNCPSSFTSKHGNIIYQLEAIMKFSSLMSSDMSVVKPIKVLDNDDLTANINTQELLFRPLQFKQQKQEEAFCCCCDAASGKFDLTFDKSAYSPGDAVILNGTIHNGSNAKMKYYVGIEQTTIVYGRHQGFFSAGKLKAKEKTIGIIKLEGNPIQNQQKKTFCNQTLFILPKNLVSTGLRKCKIINIAYSLEVWCTVNSMKIKLNKPIVVGGKPMLQNPPVEPTAPAYEESENAIPTDIVEVHLEDEEPVLPTYNQVMAEGSQFADYNLKTNYNFN